MEVEGAPVSKAYGGYKQYYAHKTENLQVATAEANQDLRRLQAQRNEVNAKGGCCCGAEVGGRVDRLANPMVQEFRDYFVSLRAIQLVGLCLMMLVALVDWVIQWYESSGITSLALELFNWLVYV